MICSSHSTGHRIMIHNLHEKVVPTIQRASPEPPKGPHTNAVNAGHRDIHTNFTDQASMQHKDRGLWHNKLFRIKGAECEPTTPHNRSTRINADNMGPQTRRIAHMSAAEKPPSLPAGATAGATTSYFAASGIACLLCEGHVRDIQSHLLIADTNVVPSDSSDDNFFFGHDSAKTANIPSSGGPPFSKLFM